MAYIFGCVLIAIPGITTDFIGLILLLPPVGNYVSNKYGDTVLQYYAIKEQAKL